MARAQTPGYRITLGAAMVMTLVLVLVAAACGGGSNTVAAASTTTTTTNRAARTQAFLSCMQSKGVKITSTRGIGGPGGFRGAPGGAGAATSLPAQTRPPTTLPPGVTQAQYDAALSACRSLLPTGGGNPQNNPALQAYLNCVNLQLTQHGATTIPAFGRAGGGGGFGQPDTSGNTTTTNPVVEAARAHCANLLPAGGFGGRGGSTTTTPTT